MASSRVKFVSVFLIFNLCFLLAMPSPSGRNTPNFTNRKSLHGVASSSTSGSGEEESVMKNKDYYGGELREAPLGPDPLHHHGVAPNKPRTDP